MAARSSLPAKPTNGYFEVIKILGKYDDSLQSGGCTSFRRVNGLVGHYAQGKPFVRSAREEIQFAQGAPGNANTKAATSGFHMLFMRLLVTQS